MKVTLASTTVFGKWTIALIAAFSLSLGLFFVFVALGEKGGDAFFSNLRLAVPSLFAAVFGIAALPAGLVAIFRSGDRSILVFVAAAIGLVVLLWVGAEALFPH
jgi:hypothetical protein